LDRFTRDTFLGIEILAKLRDMGVKLWELEHSDDRALDMTSDDDRDYLWRKESERRRIKTRRLKRFVASGQVLRC